jgi:hypothetical protein
MVAVVSNGHNSIAKVSKKKQERREEKRKEDSRKRKKKVLGRELSFQKSRSWLGVGISVQQAD